VLNMATEWRPAGWEDQMFAGQEMTPEYYYGYEAGASAMLAARDKWWNK
jgi:hypothetical protein